MPMVGGPVVHPDEGLVTREWSVGVPWQDTKRQPQRLPTAPTPHPGRQVPSLPISQMQRLRYRDAQRVTCRDYLVTG